RDSVRHARKQPNVDGRPIGLLGLSLGGYLALAAARQKDLEIACVVEFFGGLPEEAWNDANWLPPTLIIHGDADHMVSVKEAYALRGFCDAKKLPYEIKIYQGQQHLFRGDLTGRALQDARRRTLAFLKKHLQENPGEKSAPGKAPTSPAPR